MLLTAGGVVAILVGAWGVLWALGTAPGRAPRAHAPDAAGLAGLAAAYGADPDRFDKEASFCIHCGLCVRYCAEVKGAHAVGFIDRGTRKEISFVPEIAARECRECMECFPLCPTEALQAAYVLVREFKFPDAPSDPGAGD